MGDKLKARSLILSVVLEPLFEKLEIKDHPKLFPVPDSRLLYGPPFSSVVVAIKKDPFGNWASRRYIHENMHKAMAINFFMIVMILRLVS